MIINKEPEIAEFQNAGTFKNTKAELMELMIIAPIDAPITDPIPPLKDTPQELLQRLQSFRSPIQQSLK